MLDVMTSQHQCPLVAESSACQALETGPVDLCRELNTKAPVGLESVYVWGGNVVFRYNRQLMGLQRPHTVASHLQWRSWHRKTFPTHASLFTMQADLAVIQPVRPRPWPSLFITQCLYDPTSHLRVSCTSAKEQGLFHISMLWLSANRRLRQVLKANWPPTGLKSCPVHI